MDTPWPEVQITIDLVIELQTCAAQVDPPEPSLALVTLTTYDVTHLDFGSHPLKKCKKITLGKPRTLYLAIKLSFGQVTLFLGPEIPQASNRRTGKNELWVSSSPHTTFLLTARGGRLKGSSGR